MARLKSVKLDYCTATTVFHCIDLWDGNYCGVFGDGDTGTYEWFCCLGGKLETSNIGYGEPALALRDALIKATK